MSETLASEICRDLKRQVQHRNVVIAVMAAGMVLLAAAAIGQHQHTVATFTGR